MNSDINFSHFPVFYKEAIEALDIKPDGIYVDCTGGGGGHSSMIAEKLTTGHLYTIDRDPDAIKVLTNRFKDNDKVTIVNSRFSRIKEILAENGVEKVDGILADLGVSSYQLDTDERGFSFHTDAPLDMRMSKEGLSAKDVVNTYSVGELIKIISAYGEEKFAKAIAYNIDKHRKEKEIETTLQLAEIIKESYPASVRRKSGHPARKTFQAIRIEVNAELDELKNSLDDMFSSLKISGRVVIITFHSLEDRIVKVRFNDFCKGCTCPPEFPVCVCGKEPKGKLVFKVKEPSEKELEENSRSRSAKLRAIERVGE
ncbi:MAG: 16S rRNA (cytosine(1402)-N(4))-methyltransferase RsmH [Clostridia bacterium]|nr:16S rRNA (cytosine(1402)-N(4))-methyltransferase RsmH [Clostridia bacterium]